MRCKELKEKGQKTRCEVFGKDAKKYLAELKSSIAEEEKAYESASQIIFERLCISPECFERSQQELMMDPYASMELFNMGVTMEQPSNLAPEALTKEKTIELVTKSNDFAFDLFKREYID